MAQVIADRRDVDFVLHEQLEVEALSRHERFEDYDKKTIDMVISEARNLAVKEMLPVFREGDETGCRFEDGKVRVPESFHRVNRLYNQGEWLAMSDDPQVGGQGMPKTVGMAANCYFNGANYPFMLHNLLIHGAGKLVEKFGTDKQKSLYLEKMYTGEWGGTMLLTEPDAGTDVGALTTRAVKNEDGTYSITGSKIFISSGENDLVENIIHPVLARIEGAPAGTSGISLFLAPKYRVNEDGSPGEFNDVVCTGIEKKMGIHGSPTCSLSLGEGGECRATLLGEENQGMRIMFHMMNEARLTVGMQGFACASASYLNALNYARERVQGQALTAPKGSAGVPIIRHPDVRRKLLTMKSYTEGMRSLLFYVSFLEDMRKVADSEEDKSTYQGLIDILIPIAKGYITDRSFEICSLGVELFGGYGFTKEYPQEQLLRDCKITQIYEGTNGIQAMDLLGRKLGQNKGKSVMDLLAKITGTIALAREIKALEPLAETVDAAVDKLMETARALGTRVMSEEINIAFAYAHPFMDAFGDMIMAWMLLWRAVVASRKLAGRTKKKDAAFYQGMIQSARSFIHTVLPVSKAKMDIVMAGNSAALDIADEGFASKY